ncbi:Spartin [Beauveria bassiana D1-5]|uniref:Spartin n=1 Tax=Beauveria bassiana D1-5 TaxID=1245745 RepID=A0A0A2VEG0_BEABA|nr:Spartin [Beauveria bassiana D1-5]
MASGHNDPKLLYAVNGVKAYHIANGDEQSLTPSGPQTLSLLMVPTSSGFADPSGLARGNGEEDFYLHLHLPPELDLPMPATTQIYHQPPSSYLIPRWDLGPGSGAFTRLEFPAANSRAGVQEDVDTFETILAQREKRRAARRRGEAYVQGSASSQVGGRIVLVDEEDGSVIGELSDGFKVVEDSGVRPGTKDPVEITLPQDGSHNISVEPVEYDCIEDSVHPAYKKSTLVSGATRASRLLITTSDYVGKLLQNQADSFTHKTEPVANPVTFTPATHERIRRINQFSSKAAGLSASTVGSISKVTQNLASNIRRKDGKARGYDKDGNMIDSYKPGILNKSLMAFNTIVDGAEHAGKSLLNSTSSSVSTMVGHRWGPDAGEAARNIGGGFKNVGLVYIDVTGVSRRAILKSVAQGMLVGHVKDGGKVYVGGNGDASLSGANGPGKPAAAAAAYGDSKGKKPSK